MDKKIALCLSGKTRSSMFTFPYIYGAFLNSELNVDVFVHTWAGQDLRVLDLYKPVSCKIDDRSTRDLFEEIKPTLDFPAELEYEQGNDGAIELNYTQMFGLMEVADLVPDDYDYMIRCRFDLLFNGKFDLPAVIDQLNEDKYDIFVPDPQENQGGLQDRVYMGKTSHMKHAMNYWKDINRVVTAVHNKGKKFQSELLFWEHVEHSGMRVYQAEPGEYWTEGIDHCIIRYVGCNHFKMSEWGDWRYPLQNKSNRWEFTNP